MTFFENLRPGALIIILLCVILVNSCGTNYSGKKSPVAVRGVMDLSSWDFEEDGPVALNGEWEFYWGRQLESKDFKNNILPEKSGYIYVPSNWNGYNIQGKKLGGMGFATYRLKVLTKNGNEPIALKHNNISVSYTMYVNGIKIDSSGVAGITPETATPRYTAKVSDFEPARELEIIVHVSNFWDARAGLWDSITLGNKYRLSEMRTISLMIDFFLLGSILIMGLYHIGLYIFRKKYRAPLYFGFVCIDMAIRTIGTGEISINILFPAITYELLLRLNYLSFYLAVPLTFLLLNALFEDEVNKIIFYFIVIVSSIFAGIVIITPVYILTETLPYFQIFTMIVLPYYLFCVIRAAIHKRDGALILLAGFFFLLLATLNDILYARFILMINNNLAPFGLFIMFFSQALLLSKRFSNAFVTIEDLSVKLKDYSQNLEIKVEERTSELHAMNEEMSAINENLIEARDALWGEMQLAKKIQTALLPKEPAINDYEISAVMQPANDVGGDYYDVINIDGFNWIIIGDVSGHGVPAGLIMMMVQTSIHTALNQNPSLLPSELLSLINKTIRQNIVSLGEDKYMTMTVMAAEKNGLFTLSGLHQDIFIYRAGSDTVDVVATDGFWIGIMDNFGEMFNNQKLEMSTGDIMLLYTDGITEAWEKGSIKNHRSAETQMFGDKKLIKAFKESGKKSVDEIKIDILKSLTNYNFDDDVTLVIVKRIR